MQLTSGLGPAATHLNPRCSIFNHLPLIETAEAGSFDRGDVDEHIFAATLRLNKSISLLRIEPLHGTFRHICSNRTSYDTTYISTQKEKGRPKPPS